MKRDSYYFSHDYNARNDFKILFLRQQLGIEGYGIYWFLIESLAESSGKLPLKIIPVLAMQMQTNEVKVTAVINEFDLFTVIDNQFFSIRLNKHLEKRDTLSFINSEKGKKSAEVRKLNTGLTVVEPQFNKGKERKESKVKEIKESIYPTLDIVIEYFTTNGYSKEIATKAFNYYSVANWKDGNGKQVRNWKQKMQSVWFKEENKIKSNLPSYRNADGSLKIIL